MDSKQDSSNELDGTFGNFLLNSDVVRQPHKFSIFHSDCKSKF